MAIDLQARINLESVLNAEKVTAVLSRSVQDALNKAPFKVKLDVEGIAKQFGVAFQKTNDYGLSGLTKALTDLGKVGGSSGQVLKTIFSSLPMQAKLATQGIADIQKKVEAFFEAAATGNKKLAKSLGKEFTTLLSTGTQGLQPDDPTRQLLTDALTKGVQQQTELIRKSRSEQAAVQKKADQDDLARQRRFFAESAAIRDRALKSSTTATNSNRAADANFSQILSDVRRRIDEGIVRRQQEQAAFIVAGRQGNVGTTTQGDIQAIKLRADAAAQYAANLGKAKEQLLRINAVLAETARINSKLGISDTKDQQKLRGRASELTGIISAGGASSIGDTALDKQLLASARNTNKLNREIVSTTLSIDGLGKAAALAFKRYGSFLLGSSIILQIATGLSVATQEALKFEAAITKIEQVLDINTDVSSKIGESIRGAAVEFGVAGNDVAKAVLTFAQAGQKDINALASVAQQLAKIPLSATFGTIDQTVEGLIAVQGQFNLELTDTAHILDIVNQYAADFAVESADIFEGVKRGGAAFAQAGGNFEDFVSLFSVLRETTRESADTLGVFFKSGFAELLNPKSQAILKQLGVTATDVVGQVNQLASTLFDSTKFSGKQRIQIAIDLVGNRQFNRLLSLLGGIQDEGIQDRLKNASQNASGSFDASLAKRLDDVGVSFAKVKAAALNLALTFSQNTAIKAFARDLAGVASALLSVANNLQFALPLLAAFGGGLLAPKIGRFASVISTDLGLARAFGGNTLRNSARTLIGEDFGTLGLSRTISGSGSRLPLGVGVFGPEETLPDRTVLNSRRRQALQSERIRRAVRFGSGAAGIAAFGAGTLLESSESSRSQAVGGALVTGGLAASFASGVGAGPLGVAITGVIFAFNSLRESSNKLRNEAFEKRLADAKTAPEKISEGFNIGGLPGSSRAEKAFNVFGNIASEIGLILSSFGDDIETNAKKALDQQVNLGKQGIRSASADAFGTRIPANQLRVEAIKRSILEGASAGNSIVAGVKLFSDEVKKTVLANAGTVGVSPQEGRQQVIEGVRKAIFENTNADEAGFTASEILDILKTVEKVASDIYVTSKALGTEIAPLYASAVELRSITVDFKDAMKASTDKFTEANALLDTVSKGLNDTAQVVAPTTTSGALRFGGLNALADYQDQLDLFGRKVAEFVNDQRGLFESYAEAVKVGSTEGEKGKVIFETGADFIRELTGARSGPVRPENEAAFQELEPFAILLDNAAALLKKPITDVVEIFANSSDSFKELVKTFSGGTIPTEALEAAKRNNDLINRRLQLERQLGDALEDLNQKLVDSQLKIAGAGEAITGRQLERANFGRLDITNVLQSQSAAASRQANISNIPLVNAEAFTSAVERNRTATERSLELNRLGARGASNRGNQVEAAEEATKAQLELNRLTNQLNNNLTEYDRRISAASEATNLMRDAFTKFRDGIENAGTAVTSFTTKDLAEAFFSLRKFTKVGLEGLTDQEFGSLNKLLATVKDVDLGGGVTGGAITADIGKQLGVPLVAAVRSIISGRSVDEESRNVTQQLAAMEKAAAQKADEELALRQAQIGLFRLLESSTVSEIKFRADQANTLKEISSNLQAVTNLSDLNDTTKRIEEILKQNLSGVLNTLPSLREGRQVPDEIPRTIAQGSGRNSVFGAVIAAAALSQVQPRTLAELQGPVGRRLDKNFTVQPATAASESAAIRSAGITDFPPINSSFLEAAHAGSNFNTRKGFLNPFAQSVKIGEAGIAAQFKVRSLTNDIGIESAVLRHQREAAASGTDDRIKFRRIGANLPGNLAASLTDEQLRTAGQAAVTGPFLPTSLNTGRSSIRGSVGSGTFDPLFFNNVISPAVKNMLLRSQGLQGPAEFEGYRTSPASAAPNINTTDKSDGYYGLAKGTRAAKFNDGYYYKQGRRIRSDISDTFNNNNNASPQEQISNVATTRDASPQNSMEAIQKLLGSDSVFKNLDELKGLTDKLTSMDTNVLAIRTLLEKMGESEPTSAKLEISPIQVNVVLTAPDIMALAGAQIKADIMTAIGEKLSGVFSTDKEKQSKIEQSFGI